MVLPNVLKVRENMKQMRSAAQHIDWRTFNEHYAAVLDFIDHIEDQHATPKEDEKNAEAKA